MKQARPWSTEGSNPEPLLDMFNRLGQSGWEYFKESVDSNNFCTYYWFKRTYSPVNNLVRS